MNKIHDIEIHNAIEAERARQNTGIELIASENYVSQAVLDAAGSILTNKYAEGYPDKRYYGGCGYVDIIEKIAIDRAKKLFKCNYANVQPHCGSSANMAAYMAVLNKGDRVLGMELSCGGHLTHGLGVNFSGKDYKFYSYGVDRDTETIDYDFVMSVAKRIRPKLIVAGASAYSREIDFRKFREIADEVDALLMVDMAHIAGLVATGHHQSPIPYADIVTTTTHKTLRGPRGGMILTNDEEIAKKVDKAIFPGIQGGPLMHVIAAKAVSFKEALEPEFVDYQSKVIENTSLLATKLEERGFRIVSDGTDNHMFLLDLSDKGITGAEAERMLGEIDITVNKNGIPFDMTKPTVTSGIRIGCAAITTLGASKSNTAMIADIISNCLYKTQSNDLLKLRVKDLMKSILNEPPVYV